MPRDNAKYNRKELLEIVAQIGLSPDKNNGRTMGKGDHIVYTHEIYKDLKVNIPVRKDLGENEMSNICGNLIIIMKILGMDTSIFTHKEGVEGKLMKTAKNAEKNICVLFSTTVKNCLGLKDEKDIEEYINKTSKKVQNQISKEKLC